MGNFPDQRDLENIDATEDIDVEENIEDAEDADAEEDAGVVEDVEKTGVLKDLGDLEEEEIYMIECGVEAKINSGE